MSTQTQTAPTQEQADRIDHIIFECLPGDRWLAQIFIKTDNGPTCVSWQAISGGGLAVDLIVIDMREMGIDCQLVEHAS
jgi:hypothetical protein